MKSTTETWSGRIPLMVGHCAGMVDLVALPIWVGTLIERYKFTPQQAGGLASLFLVGAVLSSAFFAQRFSRLNARVSSIVGFSLAGLTFLAATRVSDYATLAALHAAAGVTAACGLSVTHGTIARSANPHRLFAIVGMALGVFAIVFLGAALNLIAVLGGAALFAIFAAIMGVAALAAAISFPAPAAPRDDNVAEGRCGLGRAVWFGIAGISCMALTQAMMFSFVERIGIDHGFGGEAVAGVLITLGFINLLPAPLAALLEKRVAAKHVLLAGPVLQASIAVAITFASGFFAYAVPTVVFVAVMIFTHTFAFGLLSRLDPTARALAGTPAMLMIGAAVGPILGGTLVQLFGYPALGLCAIAISAIAVLLFSRLFAPDAAPASASLEIA
jgi:predicted MFS family arabinose efflux permease